MRGHLDRIGQKVGDYRLLRWLGGGGFGHVYQAQRISDHTQVAVKILQTQLIRREELAAFINEARTMRLKHPHIIPLLDFGISQEDIPFLVMEYAAAGTLRDRHPKGTQVPLAATKEYISQIAAALQYAHDQRLIHRDVKPENMLLRVEGTVLLSDFGIASVAHTSNSASFYQEMGGTLPYMAPEQLLGHARPASDQYALAITAYEWLAGRRPFQGTAPEVALQHQHAFPTSLIEQVPTLAQEVEWVVFKALEKNPKERFASVQAFALAFEQATQIMTVSPTESPSVVILSKETTKPNTGEVLAVPVFQPIGPSVSQRSLTQPTPKRWLRLATFSTIALCLIAISLFSFPLFHSQPNPLPSSTSSSTTLPPDLISSHRLVYQDPLTNAINPTTTAANWGNNLDPNAQCTFASDGLHVISTSQLKACAETTYKYEDVTIVVDVTLSKGHSAGLYCRFSTDTFRNYNGYLFEIDSDGNYKISHGIDQTWQDWQSSSFLKKGYGEKNTLAIVALYNTFSFYANGMLLVKLTDTSLSGTATADRSALTADSSTLAADNATTTTDEKFPSLHSTATVDSTSRSSDIATATADGAQATADRATVVAAKGTPLVAVQAGVIAFLAVDDGPPTEAIFSNLKIYSL